ncbi:MAG TPA: hypothetical protein VMG12_36080 [Polyangiaceae bacterium]|nr:hypothetical protein [Polyangiaceae bacterium]
MRAVALLLGGFGLYVLLLLHPGSLFAYDVRYANLVLHAPKPLPPEALDVARAARERVALSPFFSASDEYDVYLCDTPALYAFLSLKPETGAVSQVYLDGNVFLRPSAIERDRLIGPRGHDVPGDRTLTYYIAHELAHTMVARHIGRRAYHALAAWQQEGYADYVGKGGSFDYDAILAAFRAGERDLDPVASGLYLRYHLLTAYELDRQGLSPLELLAEPRAREPLEAQLRAARPEAAAH